MLFAALVLFFCALISAASVETIAERIKNKKLNLENGVMYAASSLEKYGTSRLSSLEEISCALISRKKILREQSYAVEYAKALASFATENEKRFRAFKIEMPNSALLLSATFSNEEECPDHEYALELIVGTLNNALSIQDFILESAKNVELSSFILPKSLVFSSKFLDSNATVALFDDYLSIVLERHPDFANLPHEHIYELAFQFFYYMIPVKAEMLLKLFDFFSYKVEQLKDSKFKKDIMDLIFRNLSEYKYYDGSTCDELLQKLTLFLITDENLAFVTGKYIYFAALLFSQLHKRHPSLFLEKISQTHSGLTLWKDKIEAKLPAIHEVRKFISILTCKQGLLSLKQLLELKYDVMRRLRPILENPENVDIANAVSGRLAEVLVNFSETCRNTDDPLQEMALCLCFDAVRFCVKFGPRTRGLFAVPYNLIYFSKYILLLESLKKDTCLSRPYIEAINDELLEDLMGRILGFSSIIHDSMFNAHHFISFIPALSRHSNPAWFRSTLSELFAEYLKASEFGDYQNMFQLHETYPEIDFFCFIKTLNIILEDPLSVSNPNFKKFVNCLITYEGFSDTEKKFISELILE